MQTKSIISPVTTREILRATTLPKKTDSYSPVPHAKVMDMVLESLEKAGIKVKHEKYISAREGRQAMGLYVLDGGDETMNYQIGWQNSYDKSKPLRVAMGTNIIVCSNGMFAGGNMGSFKRKHTGTVLSEFQESIKFHIGEAASTFQKLTDFRERLKQTEITKRVCAELIGRMHIEHDILTATQVGIMKKELENPTYNYKADGTAWQLYNHATFALKEAHPQFHLEQHMQLHDFFTAEYQLLH